MTDMPRFPLFATAAIELVVTTPSSNVCGGRTTSGSAWILGGENMPHLSLASSLQVPPLKRFEESLDRAGLESPARIPAESINGPILPISATEDAVWPSFRMSLDIESPLHKARFPFEVRHGSCPGGHGFSTETAPRVKQTIIDHFSQTL